ncbi:hypothetical protein Ccrd_019282 [Cynara cardunculus var. scolymus]|uniref:Uncharacterized protein n=1 Tax=Cynara cardunculus var. scolymus TaxID=59895 RepID=A0A103Y4L2_CYNCS|nr:hypothetical protein Ccrd_019282 [Cynara cardunculus var. scolymus]
MVRTDGGGGDQEADDEMSPRVPTNYSKQHDQHPEILLSSVKSNNVKPTAPPLPLVSPSSSNNCIGIFSHSIPIKCVVTGILGCSPIMSNKICIQDSSVTMLQHSGKMGWRIKRLNDTSHLRLV